MNRPTSNATEAPAVMRRPNVATPFDEIEAEIRPYDFNVPKTTSQSGKLKQSTFGASRNLGIPPISAVRKNSITFMDSMPLQVWEGRVVDADFQAGTINAMLDAKIGKIPRHGATISLEWVTPQDLPLVVPGAVFYLTLYKQTARTTIKNSEEIRFRRMPAWSKNQIEQIEQDAADLLANIEG